jgi:hypothetical protein
VASLSWTTAETVNRPMLCIEILPDERGTWRVVDDSTAGVFSRHPSASDAEAAAQHYADVMDADEIVVHDRYHRTRVFRRKPSGPATSG